MPRTAHQIIARGRAGPSSAPSDAARRPPAGIFHRLPINADADAALDDAAAAHVLRSPRPLPPQAAAHSAGPVEAISEDAYERDGHVVLSPHAAPIPGGDSARLSVVREGERDRNLASSLLPRRGVDADFTDLRRRAAGVIPSALNAVAEQIEAGMFGSDTAWLAGRQVESTAPAPAPAAAVAAQPRARPRSNSLEAMPTTRIPSRRGSVDASTRQASSHANARAAAAAQHKQAFEDPESMYESAADLLRSPLPSTSSINVPVRKAVAPATRVRSSSLPRNATTASTASSRGRRLAPASSAAPAPRTASLPPSSVAGFSAASLPATSVASGPTQPRGGREASSVVVRERVKRKQQRALPRDAAELLDKLERLKRAINAGSSMVRSTANDLKSVEEEITSVQHRSTYLEQLIRLLATQLQERQQEAKARASGIKRTSDDHSSVADGLIRDALDAAGTSPGSSTSLPKVAARTPPSSGTQTLEAEVQQLLRVLQAPDSISASLSRLGHALNVGAAGGTTDTETPSALQRFSKLLSESGQPESTLTQEAQRTAALLHAALPTLPAVRMASTSAASSSSTRETATQDAVSVPQTAGNGDSQAPVSVQQLVEARMASLESSVVSAATQFRATVLSPQATSALPPPLSAPLSNALGTHNELLAVNVHSGKLSEDVMAAIGARPPASSSASSIVQPPSRSVSPTHTPPRPSMSGTAPPSMQAMRADKPLTPPVNAPDPMPAPTMNGMIRRAPTVNAAPSDVDGSEAALLAAARGASTRTCVECESFLAVKRCHECSDDFCEDCFQDVHRKGSRRGHLWTAFSPSVKQRKSVHITAAKAEANTDVGGGMNGTHAAPPPRAPPSDEHGPVRSVHDLQRRLSQHLMAAELSTGPRPARVELLATAAEPELMQARSRADVAVARSRQPDAARAGYGAEANELQTMRGSLGVYRRVHEAAAAPGVPASAKPPSPSPPAPVAGTVPAGTSMMGQAIAMQLTGGLHGGKGSTADGVKAEAVAPTRAAPTAPKSRSPSPLRPLRVAPVAPVLASAELPDLNALAAAVLRPASPRRSALVTSPRGVLSLDFFGAAAPPVPEPPPPARSASAAGRAPHRLEPVQEDGAESQRSSRMTPTSVASSGVQPMDAGLRRRQEQASARFIARQQRGSSGSAELSLATVHRRLPGFNY